jgi:hypothetical protein
MMRSTALLLATCALACAGLCEAQSSTVTPRHELSIGGGVSRGDRFDEVVSPSRFSGVSVNGRIAYDGVVKGARLRADLRGGSGMFSAPATQRSDERVSDGDLHLSLFPGTGARAFGGRVSLGLDVETAASLIAHQYSDPNAKRESYVFGTLTVGPSLLLERPVGEGSVSAQLSVPVAGIVEQPYSALRGTRSPLDFHGATIASLRSASGLFAYKSPQRGGMSMIYQYGFSMLHYENALPVRGLTHAMTIGVAHSW